MCWAHFFLLSDPLLPSCPGFQPHESVSHLSCHLEPQDLGVVHVTVLCLPVPAGWQGRVPALAFLAGSILLQGLVHSLLWKDPPSVSCYVYEPKVATVYWPPRFLSLYCRPRLIAPKHARAKLKFLHIQLLKQQQKTAQTNTFLAI